MAGPVSEKEIREKVRSQRDFYRHVSIYCLVSFAAVLIWAISGGGGLWPIWIILGWGIFLAFHAVSLGLFPAVQEYLPFFSPEWEEQQVKQAMTGLKKGKAAVASAVKKPAKKKTATKKPANKKSAPKKSK